jgi:hypothetical protein
MALPSAIKLFINPRTGLAFGNFNGTSQITNPTVTLGDTARFEIYLVEDTGINSYPRQEVSFPGTPGIKIAVGPIDEAPQAGTWKASFGGDITAALAYNITAAALATALNGLASITAAGGVSVSKIGDNYNIVFNENGARGDILTDSTALIPLSNATVAKLQIGDSTRPQIALIHLQRTIAGLATSFTATPASAITIETLAAWDGSRAEYRASITPDPKGGSFSLAFDAATGTDVSSASIAIGASAIDVQNALNLGALVDKVSVSQVGAYAYDITVTAQPGTGGLTANGAGLISFSGYVGELSLNTAEAISLLDGANFVATNLEVEITSDSKTLTVLQIPCTLKNAVIDAGSIQPLILDVYQTEAAADGRYARQANNLSDLASVSQARTNLGVYSTSSVDTALALKASLSGATFSGNIVRDNGLGQTIIAPGSIGFSQTGGGGSFATYGSTAITFADGSVQSTAATPGSFLPITGGTLTGNLSLGVNELTFASGPFLTQQATLKGTGLTISSSSIGSNFNSAGLTLGYANSGRWVTASYSDGISVRGFDCANIVIRQTDGITLSGIGAQIKFTDLSVQTTAFIPGNYLTATAINALLLNKADLAGATFTGKVNLAARASGAAASINLGAVPDNAAAPSTLIEGDIFLTDIEPLAGNFNTRLNYVGKTFSGSLAAIQLATLNGVSNYFSQTQNVVVTSTSPAFKITQLGTGAALLVEDSTTPDTSALVVDAAGNVGIGVAVGYTATDKVEVVGDLKADNFKNGSGPTYKVVSVDSHSSGSATNDLLISVGGSTYRIAMKLVSTP